MSTESSTSWRLSGTAIIACNCDYGCPCNFNALPSKGHCEGGWTWHVEKGSFGGVALNGLNFSVYVKWPGAIHHGNGEGILLIDERADEPQRGAIATLVKGNVGGPWGVLGWTWPTLHGPTFVGYEVAIDGARTRMKIADRVTMDSDLIKNPVTGEEIHPGIVLPEGLIVKTADLGCSTVFQINDAISMDHSGQYTAVGPFDYTGP